MTGKDTITLDLHIREFQRVYKENNGQIFYEHFIEDRPFDGKLINLTLLCGKGNEPRTVEEALKLFPKNMEYKK